MIFLCIFSALAVSLGSMSNTNVQLANNQHKVNSALNAALSALECGKYIVATVPDLGETSRNYITATDADNTWGTLCSHVQTLQIGGQPVAPPAPFSDTGGSGYEIITPPINFSQTNASFQVRFYHYNTDPNTIKLEGIGTDGAVTRRAGINMAITKNNEVLNYAIASRGRMWLTGNTTIHGNVFSDWDNKKADGTPVSPPQAPFNMTSDSRVEGTINTVISREDCISASWQLDGPDEDGVPVFDGEGNLIYDEGDEIQGYHEGINYGQPFDNMPGMSISDYDTTLYKEATWVSNGGQGDVPSPSATQYAGNDASLATLGPICGEKWRYERFPHNPGDYTTGSGVQLKRYIYKDQTFTDQRLPANKNALFINCAFNDLLYVDCGNTTSNYNNVRFDNCTFNGTIVSNTPQSLNWQRNCLYFTGAATFDNETGIEEATILAPHFNVNLGNTNPTPSDDNVLTGAIVGGIVDVRGNAQIYGTIISMCDTSQWSSGYVTNIGATLGDGGSETTDLGDVGVISITPEEDKMLPSGITSPIVIKPLQDTYSEGF
jgi:hypothetical protein